MTARTVDTALDILELLARRHDGARFSDLVVDLRLPKSTANSVLAVLEARKYVVRDDATSRYTLGPKVTDLMESNHPEGVGTAVLQAARDLSHRYGLDPYVWVNRDGLATKYNAIGESCQVVEPAHGLPLGYLWGSGPRLARAEEELVECRFTSELKVLVESDSAGPGVRALAMVPDAGFPEAVLEVGIPEGRRQDVDWIEGVIRKPSAKTGRRPRIGWIMADVALDTYCSVVGWAEYWAGEYGVDIVWANSEENEVTEQLAARLLLEYKVDVLVVHPVNAYYSSAIFYEAARRNIPVICFQRPAQGSFDLFVGGNAYDWGRLQVEYLQSHDIRGRVVLIEGDPNNGNSMAIGSGVNDGIGSLKDHQLTLVYRQCAPKWNPNEAARIVEGLRGAAEYEILFVANDDMANSVSRLFSGAAPRLVAGDGDRSAIPNISEGRQEATVFQDYRELARLVLEAQSYLRRGERPPGARRRQLIPQNVSTQAWVMDVPYRIIDRENLDIVRDYWNEYQTVIVDGGWVRRESDGRPNSLTARQS